MSSERSSCKTTPENIESIECNPYESQIYSQLRPIEKIGIQTCGVQKEIDAESSMNRMFFQDANYFDTNWYTKKGAYLTTDYNYEEVMLKNAVNDTLSDMIIPTSYSLKDSSTTSKEKAKDVNKQVISLEAITLAWHVPPTNKLSHSLYLNIDYSENTTKNRTYEKILFDCQKTSPPPPTPPEYLKIQKKRIEELEYAIELCSNEILRLINMNFELNRLNLLKISEEGIKQLNEMKEKTRMESRAIEVYKQNSAILLHLRNQIEDMKYAVYKAEQYVRYVESEIAQATSVAKQPSTPTQNKIKSWFQKKLNYLTSAPKESFEKIMKTYKEIHAFLHNKYTYTQADLLEAKRELNDRKRELLKLEFNTESSKANYITSNDKIKGIYYKKTKSELLTDSFAGIPPMTSSELDEISKRYTASKAEYQSKCESVGMVYEDVTNRAFTQTITFVNTLSSLTKKNIQPTNITPIESFILDTMLKFPLLDSATFDKYKRTFEFPYCDTITPLNTKIGETTDERNARSFIWVSFESAIDYLTKK